MRPLPNESLAANILIVWRIKASIEMLFVLLVPIGYLFVSNYMNWPVWIVYVLFLFYIFAALFRVFYLPSMRFNKWRYELHNQEIEVANGVWIEKRTLIPMNRVQHVDTEQGPLLKHYHLAAVSISTAAAVHIIPGLMVEDANRLRDTIISIIVEAGTDDEL